MATAKSLSYMNPRRKTSYSSRKTWMSVIAMLLWVFSSTIVGQLIVGFPMIWMLGVDEFSQPIPTAIFSALSYLASMLLIFMAPILLGKIRNSAPNQSVKNTLMKEKGLLGLSKWPTWTDIGLAPVGFVVYLLIAAGLTAIFSFFPWFNATEVQDVGFSYFVSGFDRVVAFLTLVVIAPVAEEMIFRGWLYGKIRRLLLRLYSSKMAIGISIVLVSLLFGVVHMQWNVGVNVFALSIVLCGLREITGTIHAGILLHMLKNGIAFCILYMGLSL